MPLTLGEDEPQLYLEKEQCGNIEYSNVYQKCIPNRGRVSLRQLCEFQQKSSEFIEKCNEKKFALHRFTDSKDHCLHSRDNKTTQI